MYRTRRTAVSAGRGLSAIALALALVASGCGDSEEVADPDATTTTAASGEMPGGDADCSPVEWDDVADGGEFVDYAQLVSAGDNTSFDPAAVQTLDESQITNSLFDGLTDFDYSNGCEPELKGLAAESWEVNDDSTEFVFTIKEGLEFSNGEPVLPHNFKQAWERLGSKELGAAYSYLISFIKDGSKLNEGELDTLDSIVADDEAMTLTVTLEAPLSDFPAIVSFAPLSPITDVVHGTYRFVRR
ncbi:MAG TPA: ABC transporter substrate-binding protein, partial [Microthrixaceae bacterium]|nr:ABC transporter substrate-binding protein [Microthrixaceae bacterium]